MAFLARLTFRSQSSAPNEPHFIDRQTAYDVDQDPVFEARSGGTALFRLVWNQATNKIRVTIGEWAGTAIAAIYGGTGQVLYAVGDLLYASATTALSKLAGNTTTTKKFLTQTGDGAASAAPAWGTIESGDLPSHNHAASDITGMMATAQLGSGTASASTYLRGDQSYAGLAPAHMSPGTFGGASGYTFPSSVTATEFLESSRAATKRDIRRWAGREAGKIIDSLDIVSFRRPRRGRHRYLSIIAEETDPRLTGPEQDGWDLGSTLAVAVREIQSLRRRVAELEEGR